MNRKVTIALFSTLLILSGCSKKTEKSSSATSKPKKTAVASESPEASESTKPTESAAAAKTSAPAQNNSGSQTVPSQNNTNSTTAQSTPDGTWQIISYDNGSGNTQTFTPGKDSSIIGSSSVVLNQDGSCEFNLPGMSSDGCTWYGTNISTGGTQITYSLNGNQMTVRSADGTYVFQKAQ